MTSCPLPDTTESKAALAPKHCPWSWVIAVKRHFPARQLVLCSVLCALYLVASPLSARSPEEADRLYHEVGAQLFCICGCRENLLTCSMNVCAAKEEERKFLRGLTAIPEYDSATIKQKMVERFGPQVLQVPPDSHIYPIIAVAVLLLAGAFGFGFWSITRRGSGPPDLGPVAPPDELDARIERELKELE